MRGEMLNDPEILKASLMMLRSIQEPVAPDTGAFSEDCEKHCLFVISIYHSTESYWICRLNRNFILHSHVYPNIKNIPFTLSQWQKLEVSKFSHTKVLHQRYILRCHIWDFMERFHLFLILHFNFIYPVHSFNLLSNITFIAH